MNHDVEKMTIDTSSRFYELAKLEKELLKSLDERADDSGRIFWSDVIDIVIESYCIKNKVNFVDLSRKRVSNLIYDNIRGYSNEDGSIEKEKIIDFVFDCDVFVNDKVPLKFKSDFYVYEWSLHDTGEVFYVGKGVKRRAFNTHYQDLRCFRSALSLAEIIRRNHETDIRILKSGLCERDAFGEEQQRIKEISETTNYRLTNKYWYKPFSIFGSTPTVDVYIGSKWGIPSGYVAIFEEYNSSISLRVKEKDFEYCWKNGKVGFVTEGVYESLKRENPELFRFS